MDTYPQLYPEAKHSWCCINIWWTPEWPTLGPQSLFSFLQNQSESVGGEDIYVSEWMTLWISLWISKSVDLGVINSLVASFHFLLSFSINNPEHIQALNLVKITRQTWQASLIYSVNIKKSMWAELKEDTGQWEQTQHANVKACGRPCGLWLQLLLPLWSRSVKMVELYTFGVSRLFVSLLKETP